MKVDKGKRFNLNIRAKREENFYCESQELRPQEATSRRATTRLRPPSGAKASGAYKPASGHQAATSARARHPIKNNT